MTASGEKLQAQCTHFILFLLHIQAPESRSREPCICFVFYARGLVRAGVSEINLGVTGATELRPIAQ